MPAKENPMSAALSQGAARRRTAGEQAGPKTAAEPEKLLTVAIPRSMHAELKALCAMADISMKQLVMRGISREMDAVRKRTDS